MHTVIATESLASVRKPDGWTFKQHLSCLMTYLHSVKSTLEKMVCLYYDYFLLYHIFLAASTFLKFIIYFYWIVCYCSEVNL